MQTPCTRKLNLRGSALIILAGLSHFVAAQVVPLAVAEAQRHLLQLTVADVMDTDVPPSVRDGIVGLKQALTTQTDAVITKLPRRTTEAQAQERLENSLPSASVGKIPDDQRRKRMESDSKSPIAGLYGGELTSSIKQPVPSLLLVQETFYIACGSDNILLVYSNAGGAWKRILLWQSNPYTSVGEAFGDTYETLLLRPKIHGHPLLLVLHGTPWCTSTYSAFSMDIFNLGASLHSLPLWHGSHSYRRADMDPPLTVRATSDGFEVRTSVSTSGERVNRNGVIDAVVSRKGVMRYAIARGDVHRVEPIAMNAHDSVEEWLEMPRIEASGFADEAAKSLTWKMFEDLTSEGKPKNQVVPSPSVGPVRACKGNARHFQAEVTSEVYDLAATGSRPGPAYFVQLSQTKKGYRIHAVTLKNDPACDGRDLMAP